MKKISSWLQRLFVALCSVMVFVASTQAAPMLAAQLYESSVIATANVSATQKAIRIKSVTLSHDQYHATGQAKTPGVKVYDVNGNLVKRKYYTVTYLNNVEAGRGTVIITADGTKYKGTIKKGFNIIPLSTKLSEVVATDDDTIEVSWIADAKKFDGYVLQVSTTKDFAKGTTKGYRSKSDIACQKTIKNLKAETTYYVRIRTYVYIKSTKKYYYSDWSASKKVTTLYTIPDSKVVYLTFDDGPSPYTEQLLDVLDKYNIKATFFVTGCSSDYKSYVKEIYKRGHSIGLHTWTHAYLDIYKSEDAYYTDLNKISDYVYKQTGFRSHLIRFPGGSSNHSSFGACKGIMTRLVKSVQEKGYHYYDWNVSSGDASGGYVSKESVYNNVINGIKSQNHSVVLQHDTVKNSVAAVEDIIKWGLKNGYTFLPIDDRSVVCHHQVAN